MKIKNPPPVFASKDSLPRAIKIMDALLTALEKRKFRIRWPKDYKRYFSTTIEKIEVGFAIHEKLNRKDYKPTKEEIAEQKKFSWVTPPKWDYHPSGERKRQLNHPLSTPHILIHTCYQ